MTTESTSRVAAIKALADPVRWQIVERLAGGPQSASELGDGFDISAPAISRHLKVLLEGAVVDVEPQGRQRVYSLRRGALGQLADAFRALAGTVSVAETKSYPSGSSGGHWRVW